MTQEESKKLDWTVYEDDYIPKAGLNKKYMSAEEIEQRYQEAKNTPSDINYHLPKLREYADQCDSVVEFGVRGVCSTWSFLASKASKVTSYDICDVAVPSVKKFTFICADDLKIEIEPTDMLFVDTRHVYEQMKAELKLHSGKVKKFIAAHDTFIFSRSGDDGSPKGLLDAIEEFISENTQWSICYHNDQNNGLTIIQRNV